MSNQQAIHTLKRTPQQDRAYFKAKRIADRFDTPPDNFVAMYLSFLREDMLNELRPILKEKAFLHSMDCRGPTMIKHTDGTLEVIPPTRLETPLLDQLQEMIVASYTQGLQQIPLPDGLAIGP